MGRSRSASWQRVFRESGTMREYGAAKVFLSLFIGLSLLTGCASGGGGGGGGSITPPPPQPPPPFPPLAPPGPIPPSASAEFQANWGPDFINARTAWEQGFTGEGIVVGVIDDGVDPFHP